MNQSQLLTHILMARREPWCALELPNWSIKVQNIAFASHILLSAPSYKYQNRNLAPGLIQLWIYKIGRCLVFIGQPNQRSRVIVESRPALPMSAIHWESKFWVLRKRNPCTLDILACCNLLGRRNSRIVGLEDDRNLSTVIWANCERGNGGWKVSEIAILKR